MAAQPCRQLLLGRVWGWQRACCALRLYQRRANGDHKLCSLVPNPAKGPSVQAAVKGLAGCQQAQRILPRSPADCRRGVQSGQQVCIARAWLQLQLKG